MGRPSGGDVLAQAGAERAGRVLIRDDLGRGWLDGVAYAYGRTPAASTVRIGVGDAVRQVPVNGHGWWCFLAEAPENERLDLAAVPDPFPDAPPDQGPPRIAG